MTDLNTSSLSRGVSVLSRAGHLRQMSQRSDTVLGQKQLQYTIVIALNRVRCCLSRRENTVPIYTSAAPSSCLEA